MMSVIMLVVIGLCIGSDRLDTSAPRASLHRSTPPGGLLHWA